MNGNICCFKGTLSSRIQSAKKPNVQIIGETDALLSHPSEDFVSAFVAVCPYLYLCPYLPALTQRLHMIKLKLTWQKHATSNKS